MKNILHVRSLEPRPVQYHYHGDNHRMAIFMYVDSLSGAIASPPCWPLQKPVDLPYVRRPSFQLERFVSSGSGSRSLDGDSVFWRGNHEITAKVGRLNGLSVFTGCIVFVEPIESLESLLLERMLHCHR